jgi:hypothetical protein
MPAFRYPSTNIPTIDITILDLSINRTLFSVGEPPKSGGPWKGGLLLA